MKIQYIKDAPAGNQGDIADVTEIEGNVLVKIGFAVLYSAENHDQSMNVLKNLNGTPVVDDFGNTVAVESTNSNVAQQKSKKSSKKQAKGE